MEETNILNKLNIPSNKLSVQILQELMVKAQKAKENVKQEEWAEVSKALWLHLKLGLTTFDDQLLCSTCFYTALKLTNERKLYYKEINKVIHKAIIAKQNDVAANLNILTVISLIYGMFQSTFLMQKETIDLEYIINVLKDAFKLLRIMAYEYSEYTFIVFKIINSFKRVIGTPYEVVLLNEENQTKLLNLVNHNWENPITGVRDLNRGIFRTLLLLMKEDTKVVVIDEINHFYWNKAKYLMLSEIIDISKGLIPSYKSDWISGVVYSLGTSGLVAAGADMYFSILKHINIQSEWSDLFLKHLISILKGTCVKSIENFRNYWWLATLKKFPLLLNVMFESIKDITNNNNIWLTGLSLLQQGNKLDIVKKNWGCGDFRKAEVLITNGLEYYDPQVRILAFEIICVSQEMPKKIEYNLIINYLLNNISSDCTVLRLSTLSNLSSFMLRLHTTYLNNKDLTKEDIRDMLEFYKNIQNLIIESLNCKGNYQRKITTVKICKIVLQYINEVPKKKKKQTRNTKITLKQFLQENKCWYLLQEALVEKLIAYLKDPADDVRESVVELLVNSYLEEIRNIDVFNRIIEDAVSSIKSKYFYQIACAQSIFKLIISTLATVKLDKATFQSINDVFAYGYNEFKSEVKLNRNILDSIENGKQLYSIIYVLQTTLEICLQNSLTIEISSDTIFQLIECIDVVSTQFIWINHGVTSTDFCELNYMIKNIIDQSRCKPANIEDETKLSGLHQSVLNCIWLNVKASCDLSALLIKYYKDDSYYKICEKNLSIITNVLETSRHKGAIEAAGVALAQSIRHLTSLPRESAMSALPIQLLTRKLDDLISVTNNMASVTRRGAGLSIMVQKIVSSDMTKDKILFNYALKTLLRVCSSEDLTLTNHTADIDNQKDLPKATYIHILTRIIGDCSLASDLISVKVAEIAFQNLTSIFWQIRNAALQLYGALVPKLLGQKKGVGNNEEIVATVAFDEFCTHSPKLWNYIAKQIKMTIKLYTQNTEKIQSHSNLVPLLNMLANCAPRYNFLCDETVSYLDADLFESLMTLLSSPIYTVRRLTSKTIFNIFTNKLILEALSKDNNFTENGFHGRLLLLHLCLKTNNQRELFNKIQMKMDKETNIHNHSFLCRDIYEILFIDADITNYSIEDILKTTDANKNTPGVYIWAFNKVRICLLNIPSAQLPQTVKILLHTEDIDTYCKFLLERITHDKKIPDRILLAIANLLLSFKNRFQTGTIWELLYELSCKTNLSENLQSNEFLSKYITNVSYKLRYCLPFFVRILNEESHLLHLADIILELSDPEKTLDIDMRFIAAVSNNILAEKFDSLSDNIKVKAIASAVLLLQDEDEAVRLCSANLFKSIHGTDFLIHPYLCLQKILNVDFLSKVFHNHKISNLNLCDVILNLLPIHDFVSNVQEYNPFVNDAKNIYLEVDILKNLLDNIKNQS